MIKKIEGPDWSKLDSMLSEVDLVEDWFKQYVEPVNCAIDKAVRVYSYTGNDDSYWCLESQSKELSKNHQALLINIEPIIKKTREERLEAFVLIVYETCKSQKTTPLGDLWQGLAEKLLEERDD